MRRTVFAAMPCSCGLLSKGNIFYVSDRLAFFLVDNRDAEFIANPQRHVWLRL